MTTHAYRTCPLCEATCGLDLTLQGGQVTKIVGDREDVFSRGYLCAKGPALKALHEDPDRLRRPLVRRDGELREATWGEAFAEIARRLPPLLAAHGRDALGVFLGNPNVHNLAAPFYLKPLLKTLGTRNVFSASTLDQMPKHVSSGLMFGHPDTIPVPDLDRTHYLLMLGANPWQSNGSLCTAPGFPGRVKAIRERGGKVVVVDPRRTHTARAADEHLAIRPGGDAFLLLAMIEVLFADGRVDLGALADQCAGLEEVERLAAPFTPEHVADAAGLDPAVIRRLAHELAEAESAAVYGRIGTHTTRFGTLASWAVDVLSALTGNLDQPGGNMFPRAAHIRPRGAASGGQGKGFAVGRWTSRVRGLGEARGELPTATLADEILTPGDGKIRAMLTVAGNPLLSAPDGERLERAFAGLDFMVSVDIYLNETTRHADVVLPPPSPLERSHYDVAFYALSVRNVANYSPPVLPLPEGAMPEHEILARLTLLAAGQPGADPSDLDQKLVGGLLQSEVTDPASPIHGRDPREIFAELAAARRTGPEALLDLLLRTGSYGDGFGADPDGLTLAKLEERPHGIDLGALESSLPGALSTPSGKVELAPEPIAADVARLEAELDSVGGDDGLVLVGRRHVRSNNSWMHNLPDLVGSTAGGHACTLHMHPDDAAHLDLVDGADAEVSSRAGRLRVPVELTEDIRPGVVSLPHGWGHGKPGAGLRVAAEHGGVNSNILTDPEPIDPLSGNAVLNAIPVDVRAAQG